MLPSYLGDTHLPPLYASFGDVQGAPIDDALSLSFLSPTITVLQTCARRTTSRTWAREDNASECEDSPCVPRSSMQKLITVSGSPTLIQPAIVRNCTEKQFVTPFQMLDLIPGRTHG